jgi:hypothetical protein
LWRRVVVAVVAVIVVVVLVMFVIVMFVLVLVFASLVFFVLFDTALNCTCDHTRNAGDDVLDSVDDAFGELVGGAHGWPPSVPCVPTGPCVSGPGLVGVGSHVRSM